MPLRSSVRPRRSHVFPFALVASALLWFVNWDADINGTTSRTFALGIASDALASLVAVLVVAAVNLDDDRSDITRTLFSPSNETIGVFAIVTLALGGYAMTGFPFIPGELDLVVRTVGLVLGWPLLPVYVATVAVGNSFGGQPPFAIEAITVGFGVACTTAWLFVLSGWLTNALGRLTTKTEIAR